MVSFIMKYLPAVLMVAVGTAIIYTWGMVKAQKQPEEMAAMLYYKCAKRVEKALKKNGVITRSDVEQLVKNVTVGQFYSKHRIGVTDPKAFSKSLLDSMQEKDLLSVLYKGGRAEYRLNKEKVK